MRGGGLLNKQHRKLINLKNILHPSPFASIPPQTRLSESHLHYYFLLANEIISLSSGYILFLLNYVIKCFVSLTSSVDL